MQPLVDPLRWGAPDGKGCVRGLQVVRKAEGTVVFKGGAENEVPQWNGSTRGIADAERLVQSCA